MRVSALGHRPLEPTGDDLRALLAEAVAAAVDAIRRHAAAIG
jgi:hypothetical protein